MKIFAAIVLNLVTHASYTYHLVNDRVNYSRAVKECAIHPSATLAKINSKESILKINALFGKGQRKHVWIEGFGKWS